MVEVTERSEIGSPSQTDGRSPNWKAKFISLNTNMAPIKRRKMSFNSTFHFQGRTNKAYRRSTGAQAIRIVITTKIQMHRINSSCNNSSSYLFHQHSQHSVRHFLHSVYSFSSSSCRPVHCIRTRANSEYC